MKSEPVSIQQCARTGHVRTVGLANGLEVEADLFIDMSGQLSKLTADKVGQGRATPLKSLPFDRLAHSFEEMDEGEIDRQHRAVAYPGALQVDVPLSQAADRHMLFASDQITDDSISQYFENRPDLVDISPGHLLDPWSLNLVRIGNSSLKLGEFLDSDRMMLNRDALLLMDFFPTRNEMQIEAREFNRKHQVMVEQTIDFVSIACHLNQREGDVWRSMRDAPLATNAKIRLDQFRNRGHLVEFEYEQFDRQSWIDLFVGFGVIPERFDPLVEAIDMTLVAQKLKNLARAFDQAIAALPSYETFSSQLKRDQSANST